VGFGLASSPATGIYPGSLVVGGSIRLSSATIVLLRTGSMRTIQAAMIFTAIAEPCGLGCERVGQRQTVGPSALRGHRFASQHAANSRVLDGGNRPATRHLGGYSVPSCTRGPWLGPVAIFILLLPYVGHSVFSPTPKRTPNGPSLGG
jgi:hypothetical protein